MASGADHDPATDYFHHVRDSTTFEIPLVGDIDLPSILGLQVTKFMVLQLVAGLLTLLIFSLLARKIRDGRPLSSKFFNFFEMLAVIIRDDVVRPTIGDPNDHGDHHDAHDGHGHQSLHAASAASSGIDATGSNATAGDNSPLAVPDDPSLTEAAVEQGGVTDNDLPMGAHPADRYVPIIWTFFFYILFNNLLGMIPGLGSATGDINVTVPLALVAFGATLYYGIQQMGGGGFLKNLAPEIKGVGAMGYVIVPLLYLIEGAGLLIKHAVLAIRLFANMFGGHTVLGVLLAFIAATAASNWFYLVAPASVGAQVLISLLELLVAFLQAYVFAFLATLFIATAVHHH